MSNCNQCGGTVRMFNGMDAWCDQCGTLYAPKCCPLTRVPKDAAAYESLQAAAINLSKTAGASADDWTSVRTSAYNALVKAIDLQEP